MKWEDSGQYLGFTVAGVGLLFENNICGWRKGERKGFRINRLRFMITGLQLD